MKPIIHLLVMALFTASAAASEPAINVHTQLCELSAATKLPRNIARIAKTPGADHFVAPDARTTSGQPTIVSRTRSFEVPGKGTFPVGISLSIRPTLVGDTFHYSVDYEQTDFVSFATRSATNAPILRTQKIVGMDGQSIGGEPVWLDLGVHDIKQTVHESGKRDRTQTIHKRLVAVLTFSKV